MLADMFRHPPEPRQGQGAGLCPGRRGPSQVVRLAVICPREDAGTRARHLHRTSSSCPFRSSGARLSRGARPRVRAWRPHGVEQSIAVEGLSEEGDRTGLQGAPAGFVVAVRGQDDRGNPGVRGGQMREQVEASSSRASADRGPGSRCSPDEWTRGRPRRTRTSRPGSRPMSGDSGRIGGEIRRRPRWKPAARRSRPRAPSVPR